MRSGSRIEANLLFSEEALSERFDDLFDEWSDCRKCSIGEFAQRHVFVRGELPCRIAFLGEAPGVEEDASGWPFVGRSGLLLQSWIHTIRLGSWAILNTVACRPCEGVGMPNRAPKFRERWNCRKRTLGLLGLARPKGLVLVGKTAERTFREVLQFDWLKRLPVQTIWHPAYVLRAGGAGSKRSEETVKLLARFVERIR